MGMYFNTVATTKMVDLVNRHFASDASGGGMAYWRNHKADVNPGANGAGGFNLTDLSFNKHFVLPQPGHRGRWRKWLNFLQDGSAATKAPNTIADAQNDQNVPATMKAAAGYLAPKKATYISVDLELRRQLFNCLNDNNCIEVTFSVVPYATVTIQQLQVMAMGPNPDDYVANITVQTRRIDDL